MSLSSRAGSEDVWLFANALFIFGCGQFSLLWTSLTSIDSGIMVRSNQSGGPLFSAPLAAYIVAAEGEDDVGHASDRLCRYICASAVPSTPTVPPTGAGSNAECGVRSVATSMNGRAATRDFPGGS